MTDEQLEVRLHELILHKTTAPDDEAVSMSSRVELRLATTVGEIFRIIDALTYSADASEQALRSRGGIPENDQVELTRTRDLADRLEQATNDALNTTAEETHP